MNFRFLFIPLVLFASPGYFEPWGKDAHLRKKSPPDQEVSSSLAVQAANLVILFHQKVISPVDGPRSHYRPSSSQYMKQAMGKYGFLKGFVMGCDRLLRENNEEWVYRKIEENGKIFKYDPAEIDKYYTRSTPKMPKKTEFKTVKFPIKDCDPY